MTVTTDFSTSSAEESLSDPAVSCDLPAGAESVQGGTALVPTDPPLEGKIIPGELQTRQMIDVDRLKPHPGYIRDDLDLNEEFLASIEGNGVDDPLHIVPDPDHPGDFWIIDGVRRWTGALKVKVAKVPYDLDMTLAGDVGEQHLRAWRRNQSSLNSHKTSFEQLMVLGLAADAGASRTRIRKSIGKNAAATKAAIEAGRKLSEAQAAGNSVLPLIFEEYPDIVWDPEDGPKVAQFLDDEGAVRTIAEYKSDGESVDYAVEYILALREREEAHSKFVDGLNASGVPITEELPDGGQLLSDLRTVVGEQAENLTPGAHQNCPGRGVFFNTRDQPVFYCSDPGANGHGYRLERTAKMMGLRAELLAARRHVTDRQPAGARHLDRLRGADGGPLSVEAHQSCPGSGVYIEGWGELEVQEYCSDPEANGHTIIQPASGSTREVPDNTPPLDLRKKGNTAWKAAANARQEWLRNLIRRKSLPKAITEFVTATVLNFPEPIRDSLIGRSGDDLFEKISGRKVADFEREWSTLPESRRMLVAFLRIAAAFEAQMVGDNDRMYTWRDDRANRYCSRGQAGRYLKLLIGVGHKGAPIERAVVAGVPYLGDKATAETAETGKPVSQAPGTSPKDLPEQEVPQISDGQGVEDASEGGGAPGGAPASTETSAPDPVGGEAGESDAEPIGGVQDQPIAA